MLTTPIHLPRQYLISAYYNQPGINVPCSYLPLCQRRNVKARCAKKCSPRQRKWCAATGLGSSKNFKMASSNGNNDRPQITRLLPSRDFGLLWFLCTGDLIFPSEPICLTMTHLILPTCDAEISFCSIPICLRPMLKIASILYVLTAMPTDRRELAEESHGLRVYTPCHTHSLTLLALLWLLSRGFAIYGEFIWHDNYREASLFIFGHTLMMHHRHFADFSLFPTFLKILQLCNEIDLHCPCHRHFHCHAVDCRARRERAMLPWICAA